MDYMCQRESNRNSRARFRMGPSPTPKSLLNREVEKSPFQILANWLKVYGNVSLAHFRINWLAVKWCNKQQYSFRNSLNWVNADQEQKNVRSSSGQITIVVMTLFSLFECCLKTNKPLTYTTTAFIPTKDILYTTKKKHIYEMLFPAVLSQNNNTNRRITTHNIPLE